MDLDSPDTIMEDGNIIREVLAGRRDQFQELVHRYADKVYGVAWSRLGDRHLAEEVVQETFIQGFQQLHRLKDTGKFLPWISAIARNKAINLGMRFRNELERRERWALEHVPSNTVSNPDSGPDPETRETLSETLASLNGAQRECLTLFYLQGKSVVEASKSLGITTNNFKTRLHRARVALRTKLETKLETELSLFKPSDQVRHGIMAAVLAQTTGGTGLKAIGAWFSGISIFSWGIIGFQCLAMLPGYLFHRWMIQSQIGNLKDQDGFRAKLLKSQLGKTYQVLLLAAILVAIFHSKWGGAVYFALGFVICLSYAIVYLIQFRVLKSWFSPSLMIGGGILWTWFAATLYFETPKNLLVVGLGYFTVMSAFFSKQHVPRMDWSMFLRIANMLHQDKAHLPISKTQALPKTTELIKSFIEFLSKDLSLVSMRSELRGYRVWLYPVKSSPFGVLFAPFWRGSMSSLLISRNGSIKATLGEKDRLHLIQLGLLKKSREAVSALEHHVENGIQNAWRYWSNAQNDMAKRAVGLEFDVNIYHKNPKKVLAHRLRWGVSAFMGIWMMILGLTFQYTEQWGTPFTVKRMREVQITEPDAKAYVQDYLSDKVPSKVMRKRLLTRMSNSYVFPPNDWLTGENKQKIREYLETFQKIDEATIEFKRMNNDFNIYDLMRFGGIRLPLESLYDLEFIKDTDWNAELSNLNSRWKTPDRVWVNDTESFDIFAFSFHHKLAAISNYVDLKQIDFTKAHEWLIDMQCLDTRQDFREFKKADLKKVHGLFLGRFSPLFDTWTVLSILEMTDGLDLIDKEACIEGILRLHYGEGRFYLRAVNSKQYVRAGAPDTWRAFQSLRILDALNRVEDLSSWKFRLRFSIPDRSRELELNGHNWDEVEAFLMQQAFDAYVQTIR